MEIIKIDDIIEEVKKQNKEVGNDVGNDAGNGVGNGNDEMPETAHRNTMVTVKKALFARLAKSIATERKLTVDGITYKLQPTTVVIYTNYMVDEILNYVSMITRHYTDRDECGDDSGDNGNDHKIANIDDTAAYAASWKSPKMYNVSAHTAIVQTGNHFMPIQVKHVSEMKELYAYSRVAGLNFTSGIFCDFGNICIHDGLTWDFNVKKAFRIHDRVCNGTLITHYNCNDYRFLSHYSSRANKKNITALYSFPDYVKLKSVDYSVIEHLLKHKQSGTCCDNIIYDFAYGVPDKTGGINLQCPKCVHTHEKAFSAQILVVKLPRSYTEDTAPPPHILAHVEAAPVDSSDIPVVVTMGKDLENIFKILEDKKLPAYETLRLKYSEEYPTVTYALIGKDYVAILDLSDYTHTDIINVKEFANRKFIKVKQIKKKKAGDR
jgi:hypothetical protein